MTGTSANSTAIKVLAGSDTFELTRGDVERHPDSLLHSLLATVETAGGDATLELDLCKPLSTSQLSTFAHAPAITAALYKHEHLPLQLLCEAAESYTSRDFLQHLSHLLDFLSLPGPVSKYLPAKNTIPLQYAGVLDLHIEAAAQQAVDLMLNSTVFNNGVSFFCVRMKGGVSSHYEVDVYALSGGHLSAWPKGAAEFSTGTHVQSVKLPVGMSRADGIANSSGVRWSTPSTDVKDDTLLYERINAILSSTLAQVSVNGKKGALQTTIFRGYLDSYKNYNSVSVWAVWW